MTSISSASSSSASSSNAVISSDPINISEEGIPLSPDHLKCLLAPLNSEFKFSLQDSIGTQVPFDLKTLVSEFHQLLELDSFKMTGSSVLDGLSCLEKREGDLDFLGRIKGNPSKEEVKELFLKAFERTVKITRQKHGVFTYKGRQLFWERRENLPPDKPLNLYDDLKSPLLDALHFGDDFLFITIPFANKDGVKSLDIRIEWGNLDRPSCVTSADCFQYNLLPAILGQSPSNQVTAAEGYSAPLAWQFLQDRKFYVCEKWIPLTRDGLRAYVKTISKGLIPDSYRYEAQFIEAWKGSMHSFYPDLRKYIDRHFDNPTAITAFLINLHAIISSSNIPKKAKFLEGFDIWATKTLAEFQSVPASKEIDSKEEAAGSDFATIRALAFWTYLKDSPHTARLDCKDDLSPTRFQLPFQVGQLLMLPPWKETAALLVGPDKNLVPYLGLMGFPRSPVDMRKMIERKCGSMISVAPKAALFQWIGSKNTDPLIFIPLFAQALPDLGADELDVIQKHLLSLNMEEAVKCIAEMGNPPTPVAFLNAVIAQGFRLPLVLDACRRALQQAQSATELKTGIELAQILNDPEIDQLLEQQILKKQPDLIISFALQRPIKNVESFANQLNQIPRPHDNLTDRWNRYWHKQLDANPNLVHTLLASTHFSVEEKTGFARSILNRAEKQGDYPLFFSCFKSACEAQTIPKEAVDLLVKVAKYNVKDIEHAAQVVETIHQLSLQDYSNDLIRHLLSSLPIASWLQNPRISLQCWKILQVITGHSIDAMAFDAETRSNILSLIFLPLKREAYLATLLEFAQVQSYDVATAILSISRFMWKDPSLLQDGNKSNPIQALFQPFIQNPKWKSPLSRALSQPRFSSLRDTLFPPAPTEEKENPKTLLTLLSQSPRPPEFIQTLKSALRSPELAKHPQLFAILLKLKASDFGDIDTKKAVEAYVSHQTEIHWPLMRHLLDIDAAPPSFLWRQTERLVQISRNNLSTFLIFSSQCLAKAKTPIPEIEQFWTKNLNTLSAPEVKKLMALPHLSPELQEALKQKLAGQAPSSKEFLSMLSKKGDWNPSQLKQMAGQAVDAEQYDKAIEFLRLHADTFAQMDVSSMWSLLAKIPPDKINNLESFNDLAEKALKELEKNKDPEETLRVLSTFSTYFNTAFHLRFNTLLTTAVICVADRPPQKIWELLKPFYRRDANFDLPDGLTIVLINKLAEWKGDPLETLETLSDFCMNSHPDSLSPELLDLFDSLAAQMGEEAFYKSKAARESCDALCYVSITCPQIWDQQDKLTDRFCRHFHKFLDHGQIPSKNSLTHFGKEMLVKQDKKKWDQLIVKTLRTIAEKPGYVEEKGQAWIDFILSFDTTTSPVEELLSLFTHASQRKIFSPEQTVIVFISIQYQLSTHIGKSEDPDYLRIQIPKLHEAFMRMYPWMEKKKTLEVTLPIEINGNLGVMKTNDLLALCLITHIRMLNKALGQKVDTFNETISLLDFAKRLAFHQVNKVNFFRECAFPCLERNTIDQMYALIDRVEEMAFASPTYSAIPMHLKTKDTILMSSILNFSHFLNWTTFKSKDPRVAADIFLYAYRKRPSISYSDLFPEIIDQITTKILSLKDEKGKCLFFERALEVAEHWTTFFRQLNHATDMSPQRLIAQKISIGLANFKTEALAYIERKTKKNKDPDLVKKTQSLLADIAKFIDPLLPRTEQKKN
ncbi:MAG: hypothetical protein JSS32_04045 [Verrucomicrobia bacterium]|nr:hypothetical protein [Verrucomicrobiota bacterium]